MTWEANLHQRDTENPREQIFSSGPDVSVLLVAFNQEAFVRESIESVIAQDYSSLQLIVIDDGSRDGTLKEIESSLTGADLSVELVTGPNRGISHALNQGLKRATGKYIALLAGDDAFLPSKSRRQVELMERGPASLGMTHSDAFIVTERGITVRRLSDAMPLERGNLYEKVLLHNTMILASTVLIRRSCFERVGLYDESLFYEDFDMWLRITHDFEVGLIDEPLVRYRMTSGSLTTRVDKMYETRLTVLRREAEKRNHPPELMRKAFARSHAVTATAYYNVGNLGEARSVLLRAFRTDLGQASFQTLWMLAKTFLGPKLLGLARRMRNSLSRKIQYAEDA